MTDGTSPRIYVASLSDYNAGRLHGAWVDLWADGDPRYPLSADDIFTHNVLPMLDSSAEPTAEEWAIHDYEGFGTIRLSEWESFERVAELAEAIGEHGAGPVGAYVSWASDWSEADFEDRYRGEYDSAEDFAQELAEECDDIPERWAPYIDWEKRARDLDLGGDCYFHEHDGLVFVFWAA